MTTQSRPESLTAWALTTGEAGMRSQARGLASAITPRVEEKILRLRPLWRHAPAGTPFLLHGLDPGSDVLEPPWPDLVVSCGRRAAAVALALKARAGGGLKLVHVQDPQTDPQGFDLVVALPHDTVAGPNVLRVDTALHDIRPERLAAAAQAWAPRLAHLPRPYVGVILGGSTARLEFDLAHGRQLWDGLERLQGELGGALLIVPSRRTPPAVLQDLQSKASARGDTWMWSGEGDNPYLAVLALADRLVVTADSISMLSEALATGHPVEGFMLPLRGRHAQFVASLIEGGRIVSFTGEARPAAVRPAPERPAVDSTAQAAAAVRRLLSGQASPLFPAQEAVG
ncbi:MAG: hypothetical protein JWQ97_2187 [Phenylobacterium sp.]|nr:hypothetical protein [Phenylobacterium sp.]